MDPFRPGRKAHAAPALLSSRFDGIFLSSLPLPWLVCCHVVRSVNSGTVHDCARTGIAPVGCVFLNETMSSLSIGPTLSPCLLTAGGVLFRFANHSREQRRKRGWRSRMRNAVAPSSIIGPFFGKEVSHSFDRVRWTCRAESEEIDQSELLSSNVVVAETANPGCPTPKRTMLDFFPS